MGMPKFPEREKCPEVSTVVMQIIESVAVEELAIAHILNAEGEKLQEFVKKYACTDISTTQFDKIGKNTTTLVNSLIVKEWILLNKLNSAMDIYSTLQKEKDDYRPYCPKCKNFDVPR